MPLPPDAIAAFRRDGFIKIRDVLTPEAIADLRGAIADEVARRAVALPPMAERTTYGKAFIQIMNLWRTSARAERLVRSRRLAHIAAQLLEVPAVRLYHDQALFKEAGGGHTPWHADQFYWPLASDRTITAWIPLQATPAEMGPLAFAAGSHRCAFGRDLPIGDESEAALAASLRDLPWVEEPYELGEVSFHLGWTFHRAGPNRTARPREVMTIISMDAAMQVAEPRTRFHAKDLADWMPGCVPGGPAASPLNPELWP